MPAVGDDVIVTVSTTGQFGNGWAKALQVIAITGAGYFQVVSTTGLNQITITNLDYPPNALAGVTIASGATVAPAGLQGLQGAAGGVGSSGVSRLYTNFVPSTSTTVAEWQPMDTYSLDGSSLVNIGDSIILQFEVELLKQNLSISLFGITRILSPIRRISIASGATSLTRYDTSSDLGEPNMTALSLVAGGAQTFLYRTTVELTKTTASAVTSNFKSRVRWDNSLLPASVYTNNSVSTFSIDVTNPIVFSLDIYQFQATEVRVMSLTIDKITAEV
jgi:hypothetical protein